MPLTGSFELELPSGGNCVHVPLPAQTFTLIPGLFRVSSDDYAAPSLSFQVQGQTSTPESISFVILDETAGSGVDSGSFTIRTSRDTFGQLPSSPRFAFGVIPAGASVSGNFRFEETSSTLRSLFPMSFLRGTTQLAVTAADRAGNVKRQVFSVTISPQPNDYDADGIADLEDNCAIVPNGLQQASVSGLGNQNDADSDGVGDACLALSLPAPVMHQNGVVNAASFTPFGVMGHAVAPGSIVSIFGDHLATHHSAADTLPLPFSLRGVSVTFNGIPAGLFFVSPGQINAQLPWGLTGGSAEIRVTDLAGMSQSRTIQLNTVSPAIFTMNRQGSGQGAVLFANTLNLAASMGAFGPPFENSRPAAAGDVLTIFANGLGAVIPPVGNGQNSMDQLRITAARPTVIVGNVTVPDDDVLFSGLAPQYVSLYQINFRMPAGVQPGNAVPIRIRMSGAESPGTVTIAVQ
jgi:uncharacterized protein (TIGR03437 family)